VSANDERKRISENAQAFLWAAERCAIPLPIGPDTIQWLMQPEMVCRAFAIELALKSLDREPTFLKTHDLVRLFERLDDEARAAIANAAGYELDGQFEALLTANRSVFEEMRYMFERTESWSLDIDFLRRLSSACVAASTAP
jgi:hypothetical protein